MTFDALWDINDIAKDLDKFAKGIEVAVVEALNFIGDDIITKAKNKQTYTDRTANLRSSIGYVITNGSKRLNTDFKNGAGSGKSIGLNVAKELIASEPAGVVGLLIVAGMEYAAAVEAMEGLDVISGSLPSESEFRKELKYFLG